MNLYKLLLVFLLMFMVCSMKCLTICVVADEMCDNADGRIPNTSSDHKKIQQVTDVKDPFCYQICQDSTVSTAMKVQCDKPKFDSSCTTSPKLIKNPESRSDKVRIVNDVKENQRIKKNASKRVTEVTEKVDGSSESCAKPKGENFVMKNKMKTMSADCEQCEIQIKANGDGIFLRCRKCHPLNMEEFALPSFNPDRVIRVP